MGIDVEKGSEWNWVKVNLTWGVGVHAADFGKVGEIINLFEILVSGVLGGQVSRVFWDLGGEIGWMEFC